MYSRELAQLVVAQQLQIAVEHFVLEHKYLIIARNAEPILDELFQCDHAIVRRDVDLGERRAFAVLVLVDLLVRVFVRVALFQ